eukprot:Hpha_TRINITY_DN5581_c0_g1::TRINITY_DN5581_c0_g1_i1::g.93759::m.93759
MQSRRDTRLLSPARLDAGGDAGEVFAAALHSPRLNARDSQPPPPPPVRWLPEPLPPSPRTAATVREKKLMLSAASRGQTVSQFGMQCPFVSAAERAHWKRVQEIKQQK